MILHLKARMVKSDVRSEGDQSTHGYMKQLHCSYIHKLWGMVFTVVNVICFVQRYCAVLASTRQTLAPFFLLKRQQEQTVVTVQCQLGTIK